MFQIAKQASYNVRKKAETLRLSEFAYVMPRNMRERASPGIFLRHWSQLRAAAKQYDGETKTISTIQIQITFT